MFRSAANPVLRLVFSPTLLLFYLIHQGEILPFVAPMFVVIFLTIMPSKPPLYIFLKLLVVVVVISVGVALFGGVVMHSPVGIVLFCWVGVFWSFYRSHNNPKDMLGTYLLLFTIIIFIVNRQFNISVSIMPWLTLKTFLITILVTYVSFMLFPGDEQDIKADEKAMSGAKTHLGLIAFKSTILMIVMYLLISTESSQSLLIAITVGSMIKIPISRDQRIFRNNRVIATLVGILATLPIMVAQYFFAVSQWMLIGISCFMGLQMARFAIWRKCKLSVYQLMFTNFIVLLNQIVTYHGNQPFSVEITRFASISIAILFATIILNLAQFCSTSHSGPR